MRATCLVGRRWIASPSSSDRARAGRRAGAASARSSVDLPHALGPTITVILPSGTSKIEAVGHDVAVVGERRPSVGRARRDAQRLRFRARGPGEEPHEVGRADHGRGDADRQLGRGEDAARAARSANVVQERADAARRARRRRRATHQAAGDRARHEGDEHDRSGGRDRQRRQADGEQDQQRAWCARRARRARRRRRRRARAIERALRHDDQRQRARPGRSRRCARGPSCAR